MRLITAAVLVTNGLLLALSSPPLPGIQQSPPPEVRTGYESGRAVAGKSPIPYAPAVADLDLNGQIDMVLGHVEASSVVYFNTGARHPFVPASFGDSPGTVYGFSIADVDEDGRPDIATARSDAPNVLYLASATRR